eukprot:4158739-Pleurochrysis_carterae.AAC.1
MEGYMGYPPRPDRMYPIAAAMFNVVPVAMIMETMIYMELRVILGRSTASSRLCYSIGGST